MGVSYYLCGHYLQRDGVRLHRAVYETFHGQIPKGMHVHHKDENKLNNHPSNLELMERGHHTSHHNKGNQRPVPKSVLAAAARWHGSDSGLEWHKAHYQSTKERLHKTLVMNCEQCGIEFSSIDNGKNRFCGRNCKAANRRASGVDDVTRKCLYCGCDFRVNKYKETVNCSKRCAQQHNKKAR